MCKRKTKVKKIVINKMLITMVIASTVFALAIILLPILSKGESQLLSKSGNELKENYATTDNNKWDASANGDESVIATLSDDGTLTISGTGDMKVWTSNWDIPWISKIDEIKKVVIEEGVTSISIRWCSKATSIQIPSTVTCTEDVYGFTGCDSLINIEVDENNQHYCDVNGVLYNKDKTEIIKYPEGREGEYVILDAVTSIGERAFNECAGITNIKMPDTVTSIKDRAFKYCASLSNIEMSDNLTSIADSAFEGCANLTSIEIPKGVTSLGYSIFYECSKLTDVEIPDTVTSIGDYTFEFCSSLTSIKIPSGVESLGTEAFGHCTNLTSIEIPSSVKRMYDDTFLESDKVTIKCYPGTYAETYAKENNIPYENMEYKPEITSSAHVVDAENLIIRKVKPKMTVGEFKANLSVETTFEILDLDGNTAVDTATIGTGYIVKLAEGKQYTIITWGDFTGDGQISVSELAAASKLATESGEIDLRKQMIIDVSMNGSIEVVDLAALSRLATE